MKNYSETTDQLFQKVKEYADVRFNLLKLQTVNKVTNYTASIISIIMLVTIVGAVSLCFTIGLSLLIGSWLGKSYYGFFIMGGVYLIAGLIIYFSRDKIIRTKISGKIIRELLN